MKPIFVCGVDFSGTSMVSGILQAAGIDMGDCNDNVYDDIRYPTYEDTDLQSRLAPFSAPILRWIETDGRVHSWTIQEIGKEVDDYIAQRNEQTSKRWGVKSNGLTFLGLSYAFNHAAVDWVTTDRPYHESIDSCIAKYGDDPLLQRFLGEELRAQARLVDLITPVAVVPFHDLLNQPEATVGALLRSLGLTPRDEWQLIDPITKGVRPCT